MKLKNNLQDKIFLFFIHFFIIIFLIIIIYPLYFTVIASLSDPYKVALGQVVILPKGFSTNVYKYIFEYKELWIGYKNTILYTLFGTLWNLLLTIPCGYAFTKKGLKGSGILMGIFIFTMYFGGGMIPYYILLRDLGLINNPLVMIIPGGMSVYYMILTRTSLQNNIIPELLEAARIDGAGEFRIFGQIVLPLSKAVIAVIALFYGVGHWNSFFNALLFISDYKYYPLQLILRNILILNQNISVELDYTDIEMAMATQHRQVMAEAMKYGIIFVASVPVLVAYPFVQKHFVKGVMIGSLKG